MDKLGIPSVYNQLSVFDIPDCLLPLVTAFQVVTLNNTPSRESNKFGLHICFFHSFPPGVIDVSPIFSPFSLTSSILNFILPPKGRDARIEKLYLLFCFIHIPLKPEFVIDNLPVPSLSIMRTNLGLFSSNS